MDKNTEWVHLKGRLISKTYQKQFEKISKTLKLMKKRKL